MRVARLLPLSLFLSLAGCPTEEAARPKEPAAPVDEWASLPASAEWLYATRGFSGTHEKECARVREVVKGEEKCRGVLCEHGRDLGKDWRDRCATLDPSGADEVTANVREFITRAKEKPDACATQATTLLSDGGCKKGSDCATTAQRWATQCASDAGSPLVVKMIERAVERSLDEPAEVSLDVRSCDELRKDVAEGAQCAQEFKCQDATTRLETYRSRCEGGGQLPPSITTAAFEMAILSGAKKGSPPIPVVADPAIQPTEMEGVLKDGWGAILWVCDQRVLDFDKYIENRRGCQAGTLVAARAFKTSSGDVEMRLGTLEFPNEATFRARVPWMITARDAEVFDKAEADALDKELGIVIMASLAKGGEADSVKALGLTMRAHAGAIRRSAAVREKISLRASSLTPVLTAIGKAKVQASNKLKTPELLAFARRSAKHPFADMGDAGVEVGAISAASDLDAHLPLQGALDAYLDQIAKIEKTAKSRKPSKKDLEHARSAGSEQAGACGAKEKKVHLGEKGIVACAFGFATCDDTKLAEFGKQSDEARGLAETAWRKIELSIIDDTTATDIAARMKEAGCVAPWW